MSGFLHHLAARSLGLTPEIHPRAAFPYAGDPFVAAPFAPGGPASADGTLAGPPTLDPAQDSPAPHQTSATASAHGTRLPTAPCTEQPAAPSPNDPPCANVPYPAALEAMPRPPTPPSADSARPATSVHAPSRAPAQLAMPAPFVPAPLVPAPARRAAALANDIHTATRESAPDTDPASVDLDALIARLVRPSDMADHASPNSPVSDRPPQPQAVSHRQARADAPPYPNSARQHSLAGAEAAPEVRITIGRLEVNPPPRPAPPPTPRPRSQAPMSLNDYLTRRNGGRP